MGPTLIAVYEAAMPIEREHGYVTPAMVADALPGLGPEAVKNALQKLRKQGLVSRAHAATIGREKNLAAVLAAHRDLAARGLRPTPTAISGATGILFGTVVKYLGMLRDDGVIGYINAPGQGLPAAEEEDARLLAAYREVAAMGYSPTAKQVAGRLGRHPERVRRRLAVLRGRGLVGESVRRRGPAKGSVAAVPEAAVGSLETRLKALRERTGERGYWRSQGELFAFLDELDRRGLNAC